MKVRVLITLIKLSFKSWFYKTSFSLYIDIPFGELGLPLNHQQPPRQLKTVAQNGHRIQISGRHKITSSVDV